MVMSSKAKRLAKMKMPEKKKPMDLSDLDLDTDDESPGEEAAESPEEEKMEDEAGIEEGMSDDHQEDNKHDPLAAASDDELMAEIKKRGLMKDLEEGKDSYNNEDSDDQDHSLMD